MQKKQHIITRIWLCSKARGTDKFILLSIASFANPDGSECYPSVLGIAKRCGVGERTVQRSIKNLIKLGELIAWEQIKPSGFQDKNRYKFNIKDEEVGVSICRGRGVNLSPVGVSGCHPTNTLQPNPLPTGVKNRKIHIRGESKNIPISETLSAIMGSLKVN